MLRAPVRIGARLVSLALLSAIPPASAGEVHGVAGAQASAMVEIPGGSTTVGLASDGSDGEPEQLGPATTLQPFSIDRFEVTVRDYMACVKARACPAVASKAKACNVNRASSRLDHPVNCVNWGAAQAYCVWKGGRLPTSAEWERAARVDTNRRFPWGDDVPKVYRVRIETSFEASAGAMDLGLRCVKGGSAPSEGPQSRATVISVSPGSFDRKPILDGVRAGAKLTTQFKVDWLKKAGDFVYFEGTEYGAGAPAPPPAVRALLARDPDGRWKTVELLVETADQGDKARDEFRARVDAAAARSKLPAELFPAVENSDRK